MAYSYRDIIKLKYPNKTVQKYLNNTYEGIIWNSLDTGTKPTKEELDLAIVNYEKNIADEINGSLILSVKIPAMSGTSLIPYNNTVPLITEGTELIRVKFEPTSELSKVSIMGTITINCSKSNRNVTLALFKDNVCIGVTAINCISVDRLQILSFNFSDLELGLSYGQNAPVYTLRIGSSSSTTWYVNGSNSSLFNNMLSGNSVLFLGFN